MGGTQNGTDRLPRQPILALLIVLSMAYSSTVNGSLFVRGRILDQLDQRPVAGANLSVVGTPEGGISDEEGYFGLTTTQEYPFTLHITHIAYERREIEVASDSFLVVQLRPTPIKFSSVNVTGDRSRAVAGISSAIEIITQTNVRNQGFRNLGEVLRSIPSIAVNPSPTGKQTVSIRGSNPNEVAVFLDGIRLNNTGTGLADLSVVDLQDMRHLEVVKGGSSVLYGPGAFGGVINLSTRSPDSTALSALRTYGFSDDADQDLNLSGIGRFGPFGLGINHTGKTRRYNGSAVYTNIFQSVMASLSPANGELISKYYNIENFLTLPGGITALGEQTKLISAKYSGSILHSPDWDFFLGRKDWNWTDRFFPSRERRLEELTFIGRAAHTWSFDYLTWILQLDSDQQSFSGTVAAGSEGASSEWIRGYELTRTDAGYSSIFRLQSPEVSPAVSMIHWELGFRSDRFLTGHRFLYGSESDGSQTYQRDQSVTRRMGVQMKGSAPGLLYTFFLNQGRNQRLPTLHDQFLWESATDPTVRDTVLSKEYLSTTDLGGVVIMKPKSLEKYGGEMNLEFDFFANHYTDKIAYRYFEDRPPEPRNIHTLPKIVGFNISLEGRLFRGQLNGRWAYQKIYLNNPFIFPNKPESRLVYLVKIIHPRFLITLNYYSDGPQFVVIEGLSAPQRVERRNSVNLNLLYKWRLKSTNMSLSLSVRNLFSQKPVFADPATTVFGSHFDYYEAHRELLTFRIAL